MPSIVVQIRYVSGFILTIFDSANQLVFLIACLAFNAVLLVARVLGSGFSILALADAVDWVAVDPVRPTAGLVVGLTLTGDEVAGRIGERSDLPGDRIGDFVLSRASKSMGVVMLGQLI